MFAILVFSRSRVTVDEDVTVILGTDETMLRTQFK
jgi:hypothetical protein